MSQTICNNCSHLLSLHNIDNLKDFKRWAYRHHPDKGGARDVFREVSNCVDMHYKDEICSRTTDRTRSHSRPTTKNRQRRPKTRETSEKASVQTESYHYSNVNGQEKSQKKVMRANKHDGRYDGEYRHEKNGNIVESRDLDPEEAKQILCETILTDGSICPLPATHMKPRRKGMRGGNSEPMFMCQYHSA